MSTKNIIRLATKLRRRDDAKLPDINSRSTFPATSKNSLVIKLLKRRRKPTEEFKSKSTGSVPRLISKVRSSSLSKRRTLGSQQSRKRFDYNLFHKEREKIEVSTTLSHRRPTRNSLPTQLGLKRFGTLHTLGVRLNDHGLTASRIN